MARSTLSLVAACAVLGIVTGASPAIAGPSGRAPSSQDVDARTLAPGRVVERIEIGRLGAAKPLIVKRRKLSARRAASGRLTFDASGITRSFAATSVESCFYAHPQWRRYNGFGRLSSRAWYYMEWCGRRGRVTRVMTLHCGGVGAQGFSFTGCKVRRGSTGYSRANVSGTWKFPFTIGPYTLLTRTVTVSSRHYAAGRATGTWWMYQ